MYLSAITNGFDPHSTYMAPASSENFDIIMSLQLEGIGAQLKVDDGHTVIDKLIAGGAAFKQGELKVGDRVISVGQGDEGEQVDVGEMKLNDVVKLIRGRAGTIVKLGVIPGAGGNLKIIKITRAKVELLQVKDPEGRVQQYDDTDRGILWKGPLVVMTSKFSASASEILAGAIQDYGRGLIIGDSSTHGKGTVQTMVEIGPQLFRTSKPQDLGSLKLTVQQFYRPSGDSTQQRGVLADITLPSITDHMDVAEGDLDYPVAFDKVQATPFNRYDSVSQNVVGTLKDLTTQRLAKSDDFQKLQKDIERYLEQKAKKEVPLNEQKFLARRAELDADKEEEKTFDHQANGDGDEKVFKRNYYNNEILNITLDYLRLLGKDKVAQAN